MLGMAKERYGGLGEATELYTERVHWGRLKKAREDQASKVKEDQ